MLKCASRYAGSGSETELVAFTFRAACLQRGDADVAAGLVHVGFVAPPVQVHVETDDGVVALAAVEAAHEVNARVQNSRTVVSPAGAPANGKIDKAPKETRFAM